MSESRENEEDDRVAEEAKACGLEERTFIFARGVRAFVRGPPRTLCNVEDAKQLVRSSGSVGANFIEAVESVGQKDFVFRIRISRKEAKESRYWLRLLHLENEAQELERGELIEGARQLMLILTAVVSKHASKPLA